MYCLSLPERAEIKYPHFESVHYAPFCLFFAEIYFNLTKKKQPESRKNYLFHDYSQCRFEDSNLFLFSGS